MKVNSRLAGRTRVILLVVFLLSVVGFAYEVTLTRLFSLMFQYHYVYLIVSLAIAGLSVGAAIARYTERGEERLAWDDYVHATILLAFLLIGTAIVLSQFRAASRVWVALLAAILPFIVIGFLNANLFSRFAQSSAILYAADLIGGILGLIIALIVIGWIGAFNTIIVLSMLGTCVAFLLASIQQQKTLQLGTSGLLLLWIIIFLVNQGAEFIGFSPTNLENAPPDKTMIWMLDDPSAELLETRWDPFARVDLVATGDEAIRYVFTDAGAGSIMIGYDGDDTAVRWLQRELTYLPFTVNSETTDSVLVLGAGAGKDVLMAHLAGAESITAVEINPTLVSMTHDYSDYNGDVFDLPGVEVIVADGRNFVERSDDVYDMIYANIVYSQAATPGNPALAENYIFTREALQTYWNHLTEEGRIGFVTHHGIEGIRLLVAALDMLEQEGLTLNEALQHVALVSLRSGDPQTRTSVVMIMRQPWTREQANEFAAAAHSRQSGALYLPHYQISGLESMVSDGMTLRTYIDINTDYNYEPTTDNSPFFYQFDQGLPNALSQILWISLLLTLVYMFWLFFDLRQNNAPAERIGLILYFAFLGAGFMLIEVPIVQRFQLLLGQPVLSLVVVIGALLFGAGVGSLFSNRFAVDTLFRLVLLFASFAGVTALLSTFVYSEIIRWALPFDLNVRVLVAILALIPLGVFMGVCFPSGLRVAHQAHAQSVAALWGVNAVTSVLGSALAMIIAVSFGFSTALVIGGLFYALAAGLAYTTWPRLLA